MEIKCEFHSTGKPTNCPTHTTKIPDVIDFFEVMGVFVNNIYVEDSYDLGSDHLPLLDNVVNK